MPAASLSFDSLLGSLSSATDEMGDPPNRATQPAIASRMPSWEHFRSFSMQSESFLDYQRQLNSRSGRDNAQSLFGLAQIPSIEQIRNILDQLAARGVLIVSVSIYRSLQAQGYLARFNQLGDNLLVALDGTEYYSSGKVSCPCCSMRTHRNGQVTYAHKALLPVIVAPGQTAVISLPPAFITPQDGSQQAGLRTGCGETVDRLSASDIRAASSHLARR